MILLVGSKGVLSKALQEKFSGYSMQIVGSDEASKWANPEGIKVMEDYFNRLNIQPKLIFNAAGILDPQVNDYILQSANFYLPKNLLTFCQKTIQNLSRSVPLWRLLMVSHSLTRIFIARDFFMNTSKIKKLSRELSPLADTYLVRWCETSPPYVSRADVSSLEK
jgi:hypothetical protein